MPVEGFRRECTEALQNITHYTPHTRTLNFQFFHSFIQKLDFAQYVYLEHSLRFDAMHSNR